MTQKITADELKIGESRIHHIQTRCEQRFVTDEMVAWMARYHRLSAGDIVHIQCMDHHYETIFWACSYLVASRKEFLRRKEGDMGNINYSDDREIVVFPWDAWREVTPQEKKAEEPEKESKKKAA